MSTQAPKAESASDFAKWISQAETITDEVALNRARNAFIDTLACILGAADDMAPTKVFNAIRSSDGDACSIIGRPGKYSTENAALVNGTAAHALDFDDNFIPSVTHASAVLVPALLALGEELDSFGGPLLDAYIIGLEIQAWLGRRMLPEHYASGWHSTSTIGAIGATAAATRLLGFDHAQVLNALSLATSMAGGSKIQFGSMAKPLHAGLAARAGIMASRLALAGVEANGKPFEGPWGFITLHHGSDNKTRHAGKDLAIITDGVAQKRFPCCASAHRTLDAIVTLREENSIGINDIEAITTVVPDSNFHNLRFNNPKDEKEARFSMTYCVAVAAIYGRLGLEDFTPEAVKRLDVQNIMQRVHMVSGGPESDTGDGFWNFPATTTIHLRSGKTLEKVVQQPVGTIHSPLSQHDLEEKFFACSRNSFDESAICELLERMSRFNHEKVSDIIIFV